MEEYCKFEEELSKNYMSNSPVMQQKNRGTVISSPSSIGSTNETNIVDASFKTFTPFLLILQNTY